MNKLRAGLSKNPTFYSAVGMIAVLTLLSRVFGFARWITQSAFVGSGSMANAYASANQVPNIVFEMVAGGALAGLAIPLLAAPLAKTIKDEANQVASALLTWTIIILVPLAVVIFGLSDSIAGVLPATVGSDVHTQNALAGFFLRVFAWQIPLYGIGVVLSSILQAKSKFFWPAIAPILSSVVVITAFVLYGQLGGQTGNLSLGMGLELGPNAALQVLSWGTTLGVVALTLPLLIPVRKLGIKFYPCLRLPAGRGKQALGLAGASIVALCAQQLWVITNLGLARSGGELGTVAVFQYTQAVFYLPYAVLAVPVITAVFPRLSAQAEEPGLGKFAAQAGQANRLVASVSIYGGAALVAVAPAIAACFQVLTPVHGMNGALVALAPGVFGLAMMQLNTKALYALKMGRLAAVATTIGWVSACGLALLLVRLWAPHGANGPATLLALGWAHSGGVLIGAAGLLLALRRKVGPAITQSLGQVISVTTVCMLGVGLAGNQLCALLLRWWGPGIWNGLGAGLVVFAVVTAVFTVIWYGFLAKKTAPVFAN